MELRPLASLSENFFRKKIINKIWFNFRLMFQKKNKFKGHRGFLLKIQDFCTLRMILWHNSKTSHIFLIFGKDLLVTFNTIHACPPPYYSPTHATIPDGSQLFFIFWKKHRRISDREYYRQDRWASVRILGKVNSFDLEGEGMEGYGILA